MKFKYRIKELREAKGFTQSSFAEYMGVTRQCINNWENGNIHPSIQAIIKMSEKLDVTTDYLLGIDSNRKLDVTGLTDRQVALIQELVDNLKKIRKEASE